jgi:hypothetical protein
LAAVEFPPSPKFQLYAKGPPSGSDDPALEKLTFSGAVPFFGDVLIALTGGWFTGGAVTLTVIVLEVVLLAPSDTVNLAL